MTALLHRHHLDVCVCVCVCVCMAGIMMTYILWNGLLLGVLLSLGDVFIDV